MKEQEAPKLADMQKPPLTKKNSQMAIDASKKQEKVRKYDHRYSLNGSSAKNSNASQSKEKRRPKQSPPVLSRNKQTSKRLDAIERNNTLEPKEAKPLKPSQISRKEARARIGLGDIPDDKIEEIIKVKKEKVKNSGSKTKLTAQDEQILQPSQPVSRQLNRQSIEKAKSSEGTLIRKPTIK